MMFRIASSPSKLTRSLAFRRRLSRPRFPLRPVLRRQAIAASKGVLDPLKVIESESTSVAAEAKYEPLTTQEVKKLATLVCNETNLAQIELKLGSFKLKIRRNIGHNSEVSVLNNVQNNGVIENVSPLPTVEGSRLEDSFFEDETFSSFEESIILIDSPKVGIFRHGVFNKKGKKVRNGPRVGDEVRKGQVICVIEQLGTFTPILAPQKGEILAFPFSEGEPVAYKDAVAEFAPFFGGHITIEKK